jgi:hypothetical protein
MSYKENWVKMRKNGLQEKDSILMVAKKDVEVIE